MTTKAGKSFDLHCRQKRKYGMPPIYDIRETEWRHHSSGFLGSRLSDNVEIPPAPYVKVPELCAQTLTLLNQYSPVPRARSSTAGKDATRAQIYASLGTLTLTFTITS